MLMNFPNTAATRRLDCSVARSSPRRRVCKRILYHVPFLVPFGLHSLAQTEPLRTAISTSDFLAELKPQRT